MTEEALDARLRQELLNALESEWGPVLAQAVPVDTSKNYRRQMRAMLADPAAWLGKKTRPVWKKVLRSAAAIFLASAVALGTLLAASPAARAAAMQWIREWYDTQIVYHYDGQPTQRQLPDYEITNLPQGYVKVDELKRPEYISVTYENPQGELLYLSYAWMQEGIASVFTVQDVEVSDLDVNGCPGQLMISLRPDVSSAITWVDEGKNIQFTIDGFVDGSGLLHMAQGVSLVKSTK